MEAVLYLEDGTTFHGKAIGKQENCEGEIVFTTSMTGYQETLTDPSYCNQIVTFTYPLIGNYGINKDDMESIKPNLKGVVVKENCDNPSNYRSRVSLNEYLKDCNLTGISGIDTRKLTRLIRNKGTMKAKIICNVNHNDSQNNISKFNFDNSDSNESWVMQVTTPNPYVIPGNKFKLVILDLGCKKSLIHYLSEKGAGIVVVPANTNKETILSYNPDGVILSNGPGDPKSVPDVIKTVKSIISSNIPVFGVCLGHQIIGLSQGFDSFKMKFGHRGINHPVKNLITGKVSITSQNHGYALKNENVPPEMEITHLNVNDNTVEGIKHKSLPVFSVQFHPEANPGPKDNKDLIQDFLFTLEKDKN
ncbi:glutamine-hydrolyzing carbamoyl-phosphate synthase small subunit [Natranaerofaba carboxydovora]|uniref:glutamine-hydrolyzing carbamoyl-phosphate synthase small subunit n=1 Tax=Natranaerofaba carboxydovora TaxID=2742683 RepID=UPI001F12EABB|nr:glutamine-hydrolyzing carbamoyl-phosphate synthase small subunit [Natranaerofaba carboxydovora]UMZ73824.1 Carbamoyl-phosphate synthase small chain [Natranaerofaba carboxydovora]